MSRAASKAVNGGSSTRPPVAPARHPDVERFERRGLDGAPAVGLV